MRGGRIFKIQTDFSKSKHLVYDRKKEFFGEFPYNGLLFEQFGHKGYALAIVDKKGLLHVKQILQKSDWPNW